MKVELIQTPETITEEFLKDYIAKCVSVVRNKDPKNYGTLFDRLLKESYGDKASRVLEFIPCTVDEDFMDAVDDNPQFIQLFGFFTDAEKGFTYHTNARELLNLGFTMEDIIPKVDFTNYRVVKITAPYFIYGQISTHTQITSISHSNRYTDADMGYWVPDEVVSGADPSTPDEEIQAWWDWLVTSSSKTTLEYQMKAHGVKRREVYARGSDMLQYRVYTLGGYINNPNAWPHFINQRMRDPHTQLETRRLAELINKAIS